MEEQRVGRNENEEGGKGLFVKGLKKIPCYGVWILF